MKLDTIQRNLIIPKEQGILERKEGGFLLNSPFTKSNLPFVLWGNEYLCDNHYKVDRQNLECLALINLVSGNLSVRYRGKQYTVNEGETVFLDLNDPHIYYVEYRARMRQFLIGGTVSFSYFDLLFDSHGPVFQGDTKTSFLFHSLYQEISAAEPNQHRIALLLQNLFCMFASEMPAHYSPVVSAARNFMTEHYRDKLSLDEIAAHVSLSKYHFTRMFKKETGYTPWEYLIQIRLRRAMQILSTQSVSVEQTAELSGFGDVSHFIRTFRKEVGITPDVFRTYFANVPMGLE